MWKVSLASFSDKEKIQIMDRRNCFHCYNILEPNRAGFEQHKNGRGQEIQRFVCATEY